MLEATHAPPPLLAVPTGTRSVTRGIGGLGLRRIEQVRVIVGSGRTVAEVTGVAHRYPRTFRISLATATQLADAGVPLKIEHRSDNAPGEGR